MDYDSLILFALIYLFVLLLSMKSSFIRCFIIVIVMIIPCFLRNNHLPKEGYKIKITLSKEHIEQLSSIKDNKNLGTYANAVKYLINSYKKRMTTRKKRIPFKIVLAVSNSDLCMKIHVLFSEIIHKVVSFPKVFLF